MNLHQSRLKPAPLKKGGLSVSQLGVNSLLEPVLRWPAEFLKKFPLGPVFGWQALLAMVVAEEIRHAAELCFSLAALILCISCVFFSSFYCRVRPFLLALLSKNEQSYILGCIPSSFSFLLFSRSLLSSLFLCPSAANVANPLKHLSGPHWLAILVNCVTLTLTTTFKIERTWHQRKLLMASNFQATESSFKKLSIRKQIVTFPISVNQNATQKQESLISRKAIENLDDKANMQSLWRITTMQQYPWGKSQFQPVEAQKVFPLFRKNHFRRIPSNVLIVKWLDGILCPPVRTEILQCGTIDPHTPRNLDGYNNQLCVAYF